MYIHRGHGKQRAIQSFAKRSPRVRKFGSTSTSSSIAVEVNQGVIVCTGTNEGEAGGIHSLLYFAYTLLCKKWFNM